jgi:hypothetical protein
LGIIFYLPSCTCFTFVLYLASINYRDKSFFCLSLPKGLISFLRRSLTHSAYLRVFIVFSEQLLAGDTLAIIVVLLLPVSETLSTYVSELSLKGTCICLLSKALMHSFKANSDKLISAPSCLVCLLHSIVSAPLSFPAKSMKLIFP